MILWVLFIVALAQIAAENPNYVVAIVSEIGRFVDRVSNHEGR